jgi:glutamine synthetase
MNHDYLYVEYIWIDGNQPTAALRSKTRVVLNKGDELPALQGYGVNSNEWQGYGIDDWDWSFDGSSTNQALGDSSDCVLKPVALFRDPLRERSPGPGGEPRHHILVLCEVFTANGEPHPSNTRAPLREIMNRLDDQGVGYDDCWFGFEQEHTLFVGSRPLGFGDDRRFPAAQGPYYCGVGADEVKGRALVEEHMEMCARAGVHLTGINAEVMPGQWEFQIGGPSCGGIRASDHLWMARWLLYRIGESHGVTATLDPKPVPGDWNGAGMHTNFSTPAMRAEGGIKPIEDWCNRARDLKEEHLAVYGDGIEMRLTGKHETCSHRDFKWGVSDRTASIRIPLQTAQKGCGYLEDRRPNANACPYAVAEAMLKTAYDLWGKQETRPAC